MSYRIAGIDVHKKMLAVVVSDVEVDDEYQFERRMFGSNPEQLRSLAAWLLEQEVEELVMESTTQYWKPVWEALERYWKPARQKREGAGRRSGTLHLAQAQSNRGPRGRKRPSVCLLPVHTLSRDFPCALLQALAALSTISTKPISVRRSPSSSRLGTKLPFKPHSSTRPPQTPAASS
jgi:hypothetical protein